MGLFGLPDPAILAPTWVTLPGTNIQVPLPPDPLTVATRAAQDFATNAGQAVSAIGGTMGTFTPRPFRVTNPTTGASAEVTGDVVSTADFNAKLIALEAQIKGILTALSQMPSQQAQGWNPYGQTSGGLFGGGGMGIMMLLLFMFLLMPTTGGGLFGTGSNTTLLLLMLVFLFMMQGQGGMGGLFGGSGGMGMGGDSSMMMLMLVLLLVILSGKLVVV